MLDCNGRGLDLSRPQVMGILNVTPDSFSDGGDFFSADNAAERALRMVENGAAIIDVGGESTRPGAQPVPVNEELRRVLPVIETLQAATTVPNSIDTRKPEVMRAAVAAGAGLINDVYALQAEGAIEMAAGLGVPVCLMHMQGLPETMQDNPDYTNVVDEVTGCLTARADACIAAGIPADRILVDPGFGFGKTVTHNLQLLQNLEQLVRLGYPVLVGLSRKSFMGKVLDLPVDNRLYPSVALAALAVWQGATVIRCHDVRETVKAVRMCEAVRAVESSR